jgi:adenylosuccinate lyase
VGRAPEQTRKFVAEWVEPALAEPELKEAVTKAAGVKVELTV